MTRVWLIGSLFALVGCGDDTIIAVAFDALDATGLDGLATTDTRDTTVAPPDDTTVAPPDTPDDTTVAPPDDTTVAPDDTTVAPPDDTTVAPPDDTTVAPPDDTTVADTLVPETTVGPEPLPPANEGALSAPPYLMWVTPTEVSVRWETKQATIGRVDFGATEALEQTLVEPSARTTHELRLTGLTPDTTHHYRVVYDGGALPARRFRTAPDPAAADARALRFIVWGDNQNGPDTFDTLTDMMSEFDPDFAVSVGDCVQNGERAEYREQLFGPMAGFADEVPFLVAAGNHERYGDPDAALFAEYFSQPGDEHCFGWRYGEIYILFLDTDLPLDGDGGQRACVEAALSSPEALGATVQAAAFHKPPRVEWWFGGYLAFTDAMEAPWVREDLEPLLAELGVDLVFNGHNHLYAHSPDTPSGITWVTTGGGGGMLDQRGLFDIWRVGNWDEIKTTLHEFHYLQVTVHAGEVHVVAIDLDGDPMHEFYVYGD